MPHYYYNFFISLHMNSMMADFGRSLICTLALAQQHWSGGRVAHHLMHSMSKCQNCLIIMTYA